MDDGGIGTLMAHIQPVDGNILMENGTTLMPMDGW